MPSHHLVVLRNACALVCATLLLSVPAAAQGTAPAGGSDPTSIEPPPPVAPAVINRDGSGRATVRAVRIATPLRIDGRLDEAVFTDVPAMSGFIQNDPNEGAPADEKTDVWVLFNDDNLYVVCRCWESEPERLLANEMRRDNVNIVQNDQFAWSLDTFYDRRNMLFFEVSAAGGRIDGQVTNERQISLDWNPIWDVKTSRSEDGYVVEAAIPFKSMRYSPGSSQVWGFQVRRYNKWRNEYSYLTTIPASVGDQGHFRASLAATLVGLEAPPRSINLDIKPYAIASLTSDRNALPAINNAGDADVGIDIKYGVTPSLAADFTINTDFAQVEADEQQINLTRFSLFFPEKREFFLENTGAFSFAGGGDTPTLFYSRQIGLSQGREVPIRGGARLSGRVGAFTIGLLDVQAGDEPVAGTPSTNFSVIRIKRDILRRSSLGVIYTGRSVGITGAGSSQSYGADGSFSFGSDLAINAYWARTQTDGVSGKDTSYKAVLDYDGDRYGAQAEHLMVGAQFNPELGFARRRDMQKNLGMFRFSPRPKNNERIRKYVMQGTFTNIENGDWRLETRTGEAAFEIQLQNSDVFSLGITDEFEYLPVPFRIATGVTLPVGGYDFRSGRVGYNFGRQRNLSGNLTVEYGTFYNGHKTTMSVRSGRLNLGPQLSFEPSMSSNRVDVVQGAFTTHLVGTRVTYTMTPLMFATSLIQYNSGSNTMATNVRFRWEYQPGSEFFLVYNEQRDTLARAFPDLANRAVVVKINRVFRY